MFLLMMVVKVILEGSFANMYFDEKNGLSFGENDEKTTKNINTHQ